MKTWPTVGRWEQRRWAVEGCRGAGRPLAQRLAADGKMVLDVPAKPAARVRVYSRGHGRKADKHDAVSTGLAALDGTPAYYMLGFLKRRRGRGKHDGR